MGVATAMAVSALTKAARVAKRAIAEVAKVLLSRRDVDLRRGELVKNSTSPGLSFIRTRLSLGTVDVR